MCTSVDRPTWCEYNVTPPGGVHVDRENPHRALRGEQRSRITCPSFCGSSITFFVSNEGCEAGSTPKKSPLFMNAAEAVSLGHRSSPLSPLSQRSRPRSGSANEIEVTGGDDDGARGDCSCGTLRRPRETSGVGSVGLRPSTVAAISSPAATPELVCFSPAVASDPAACPAANIGSIVRIFSPCLPVEHPAGAS